VVLARKTSSLSTAVPKIEEGTPATRTGNWATLPAEAVKTLFPNGPPPPFKLVLVSGFEQFWDELEAGPGFPGVAEMVGGLD
jgi:hypothetical protein